MAARLVALFRKRGPILLVVSALSAVLSAKGVMHFGFWDGPG